MDGDAPHIKKAHRRATAVREAVRLTFWLLALTLALPSSALASSIQVVPKQGKTEKPETSRPPAPPAVPPAPSPPEKAPPSAETARLEAESPPPPKRFRLKLLPALGIGAAVAAGAIGTGLLIGAAGELDQDQFTFDAEERDDGTIDVDITDDFRDAQRAVILKGFGGTFLVSASATLLTVSLLELFRRPAR